VEGGVSEATSKLTSLWLIRLRAGRYHPPPRLPVPDVDTSGLVAKGINPNKMRKGKSGEIERRG
jgi:hypothetical protein